MGCAGVTRDEFLLRLGEGPWQEVLGANLTVTGTRRGQGDMGGNRNRRVGCGDMGDVGHMEGQEGHRDIRDIGDMGGTLGDMGTGDVGTWGGHRDMGACGDIGDMGGTWGHRGDLRIVGQEEHGDMGQMWGRNGDIEGDTGSCGTREVPGDTGIRVSPRGRSW